MKAAVSPRAQKADSTAEESSVHCLEEVHRDPWTCWALAGGQFYPRDECIHSRITG